MRYIYLPQFYAFLLFCVRCFGFYTGSALIFCRRRKTDKTSYFIKQKILISVIIGFTSAVILFYLYRKKQYLIRFLIVERSILLHPHLYSDGAMPVPPSFRRRNSSSPVKRPRAQGAPLCGYINIKRRKTAVENQQPSLCYACVFLSSATTTLRLDS